MTILRALLGIAFLCAVAWLCSTARKRFPWRIVGLGLVLQLVFAGVILGTDGGRAFFEFLGEGYRGLAALNVPGTFLVFGPLSSPERLSEAFGPQYGFVFAFAGVGLPLLIAFAALMSVLYHLGVLQVLIWGIARLLSKTMGVSGAESLSMGANVFVGMTEAPLVVRPYIAKMTTSELNAMMTGGFATIAGTVLAVYMGFIGPELGPHLLTASVMSAPAALLMAKIFVPETETSATGAQARLDFSRRADNVIEAAAIGTTEGLKLALNVVAMLIAFLFLVNLVDVPIGWLGQLLGVEGELSLSRLFGFVFAPVAWLMGVEGWHDSQLFGSLLGTKIAVNELVGFQELAAFAGTVETDGPVFEHRRSAAMAAYALCGFANFASIGIQLGGIGPLAPERRADLARLAPRAMLGGAFASWLTATIAGVFL